jgi:GntR family transcriptional regulator
MLDKTIPVPPYCLLVEDLRKRICAGDLKPSEHLPSERELGEQFGTSCMIVHQAAHYLIREEVLVVRQGLCNFAAKLKLTIDPCRCSASLRR